MKILLPEHDGNRRGKGALSVKQPNHNKAKHNRPQKARVKGDGGIKKQPDKFSWSKIKPSATFSILIIFISINLHASEGITLTHEHIQTIGAYIISSKEIEAIGRSSCKKYINVYEDISSVKKYVVNKFKPENRSQLEKMFSYNNFLSRKYILGIEERLNKDSKRRTKGRLESCQRLITYYETRKKSDYKKMMQILNDA